MSTDLFDWRPPAKYPERPGSKRQYGQSVVAARKMAGAARTIADRIIDYLQPGVRATPDEIAKAIEVSIVSVRPRCSELIGRGLIRETSKVRRNASGHGAAVLERKH